MASAARHETGLVIPFHAAIQARAARVRRTLQLLGLVDGRGDVQSFLTAANSDRYAIAYESEFGAFFNDADTSRVPVRTAKQAWTHYHQAVDAFGANAAISVRYGGDYGDCRALQLVWHGAAIGLFTILDTHSPRSAAEIACDLQKLINSSSQ